MRARTFFSFYDEGNKLQAKEYLQQLKIARQPIMKHEYYDFLEKQYLAIINPNVLKLPPKPQRVGMDLANTETKNHIINLFARRRRGP